MTREELQELFDEHDRICGPPEDGLTKWRREAAEQEERFAREREKSRNLTDLEMARGGRISRAWSLVSTRLRRSESATNESSPVT